MTFAIATSPSTATTSSLTPPTARIQASGGLTIAVKLSMPNIPRFDIVKVNSEGQSYIKRIIGLPNENLILDGEKIYINYVELDEKFELIKTKYSTLKISLGKNEIFLMGDNRVNSVDSRTLGPFNLNDVVGLINN